MRLDPHASRPGDRPGPAFRGSRSGTGLPSFFGGMTASARAALDDALGESGGLILIAGPPGSGRPTTVRGLLRARPDALAVGALEGPDQAASALRIARGRLVLATSNAGDSIGAVRRLAAAGAAPFSIACVLRLALAQRRAQRLCPSCRAPEQAPNRITAPLGLEPGALVYRARGCDACDGKGVAGSIGVFESMPVDCTVGRLIVCGTEESAIANHVFRTWPNLVAAVRALAIQGLIGGEEAIGLLRPRPQPQ